MGRLVACGPVLVLSTVVIASCADPDTSGESENRILLDTLAVLVDDGGEGGVFADFTPTVRRGPGDGLTASTNSWTRLVMFDDQGQMLRTVGTPGNGPGEFGMPTPPLELSDGRLLVHDVRRRRLIEFDADFSFIREHITAGPSPLFVREDGLLVASGVAGSPEAIGQPAHLLDIEGTRIASFGSETGAFQADRMAEFTKRAAPGPDGLVWLAPATPYRVELWDPHENRLVRVYEPRAEWFDPSGREVDFWTAPPPSYVEGIWQDGDGPLWVLITRASRDWRPPEVDRQGSEFPMTAELKSELYEVVLHALDPDSGEIIAEAYLDGNLRHFPPGMVLVGRTEVSGGTVTVPVMIPRLRTSEQGGGPSGGP